MGDEKVTRRGFLKATLVAGATVAGGWWFRDRHPVPARAAAGAVQSFGIPGAAGRMCIVRGTDPAKAIRRAIEEIGGIKTFVQKGDKVLIKVNCAFARPAWVGATTSPEAAAELVRLCREAGASAVRVTDFPINDARTCFLKSGLGSSVTQAGGDIFWPTPASFRPVRVSDGVIGTWEVFYEPLAWCDKLIGLPTAKSHNLCGASLAMKNWYGFIGGSRNRFHQDIHTVVAELGAFIKPTLVVLDGTRLLVRNGPTGGGGDDVTPGNTIVASTDVVAVDAFGVELLGLDKTAVRYIALAETKGLGKSDYRKLPGFKEVSI